MKRSEMKILGLSHSSSQMGSYVIVLSSMDSNRKLPLIIKSNEAQRIAIELENIKPTRPMIFDTIKTITDSYSIDIQEVYIYELADGIYYTKLITSNGVDEFEVECTAGEALALSIIYECPIFTTKAILDKTGVDMNDDGTISPVVKKEVDLFDMIDEENNRTVPLNELKVLMEEAIRDENYELAAQLRDKIKNI